MTRISLFLFLCCCWLASMPSHAISYENSLVENISANVKLQLITSDLFNNHIYFQAGSSSSEQVENLRQAIIEYAYQHGLRLSEHDEANMLGMGLTVPNDQLNATIKFINSRYQERNNTDGYLRIIVAGKFNQQKLLGEFHSSWHSFNHKPYTSKVTGSLYQRELQPSKGAEEQNKIWERFVATLLFCGYEFQANASFKLSQEQVLCKISEPAHSLSDGDVANFKSDLLEWLVVSSQRTEQWLWLIAQFDDDENIKKLEELIAVLPSLSIEAILNDYEELLLSEGSQQLISPEIKKLTTFKVSELEAHINFQQTPSESLQLIVIINKQFFELCKTIDCDFIKSKVYFSVLNKDRTWLLFEFSKGHANKQLSLISQHVLRPLFNSTSNIRQSDISVSLIGDAENDVLNSIFSEVAQLKIDTDLLLDEAMIINTHTSDDKELIYNFREAYPGQSYWAASRLYGYWLVSYWQEQVAAEKFSLLESASVHTNLFTANQIQQVSFEKNQIAASLQLANLLLDQFRQNMTEQQFLKVKAAVITRTRLIDTTAIEYQAYKHYYHLDDLTAFLTNQVENLSYKEFQSFLASKANSHPISIDIFTETPFELSNQQFKQLMELLAD